ncbi:MAG: site-specific integrase [candidate division Zixibacteria bacterium]|nr:site-specific integrase [Gammaproteobacteria bacterium]NIX55500.1 site-specific integrase [candidate division Zixibacteria bacterium]
MSADNQPATAINSETTLSLAINGWQLYLEDQGSSIHTIKAFIGDLNLLASYMPPDQKIGSISTRDLDNFLDWMQNKRGVPCSPKTLSRRITSLKSFFRWLAQYGALLVNPAEKVVQKSVRSPLPSVMYPDEMQAALEAAERYRYSEEKADARYYVLLKLLLDTGIKKGELLTLTTNHIDQDAPGGPILFVRYSNPKYRYKERKIAITPEWIEAYEEYARQYDLSEKLFPWSPRRLEYLLEDIGKEIGLEDQLSFLMCRWTCALYDLTSGMEPNKIRQKLGISEIQWREVRMKLRRLAGAGETKEKKEHIIEDQSSAD